MGKPHMNNDPSPNAQRINIEFFTKKLPPDKKGLTWLKPCFYPKKKKRSIVKSCQIMFKIFFYLDVIAIFL